MLEGKLKRIGSIFLVLIMVLSLWNVPVYGAGSGETVSVSENVVTSETSSIKMCIRDRSRASQIEGSDFSVSMA